MLLAATQFSSSSALAQGVPHSPRNEESLNIALQFDSMQMDSDSAFAISNWTYENNGIQIEVIDGHLFPLTPVDGRLYGFTFEGDAKLKVTPPIQVERDAMQRSLGVQTLDTLIGEFTIFFGDRTTDSLMKHLTHVPGVEASDFGSFKRFKQALVSRQETERFSFDYVFPSVFELAVTGSNSYGFGACFYPQSGKPFLAVVQPEEFENVRLFKQSTTTQQERFTQVAQWLSTQEREASRTPEVDNSGSIHINEYEVSTVVNEPSISVQAQIGFTVAKPIGKWLSFKLFGSLGVTSVATMDGQELEFRQAGSYVMFEMPYELYPGDMDAVIVSYDGPYIFKIPRFTWYGLYSNTDWLPQTGYLMPATYKLSFDIEEKFTLVSIGKKIEEQVENGRRLSKWQSYGDAMMATFAIGVYESITRTREGLPDFTIFKNKHGHSGMVVGDNYEDLVAETVMNSYTFYTQLLGEVPGDHFYVSEIPGGYGQSFPQMIVMSGVTFMTDDVDNGFQEAFRAHEVAHQWWGHQVSWASYRDQWISEGFTEYYAYYYTQQSLQNPQMFYDFLEEEMENIVTLRKSAFSDGAPQAPLNLGFRMSSDVTRGDYQLLAYQKGALFVHMLRMMMTDLNKMDDRAFWAMMKEFYTTNIGRRVTTADFQKVAEKYCQIDLTWFFDQWVYRAEYPSYSIATDTKKVGENWVVNVRWSQENVQDDFRALMPVTIDFGEDRMARLRIDLNPQNRTADGFYQVQLPPLPLEPEEISFNDFISVMCTIDEVDWDEWED